MRTDFDTENYGQRWQVETVFSIIKRNFGRALKARRYWSHCREMLLLVLRTCKKIIFHFWTAAASAGGVIKT
ncbi:MAG: transposase [Planctomycetes bacterium]|nr:transposase [Planctomycetota bacterium]